MDWEILGLFALAARVIGRTALSWLAGTAGVFSLGFALFSIFAASRFLRRNRKGLAGPSRDFLPAVTILKPLKGEDRGLYENLASFCRLDYPKFQLLFALASPDDPALGVLTRLRRDFPHLDIEIVVSGNRIGFNPKINNLSNAAPFIKHDFLLMSDSDIRVPRDFLRRGVAPFRDPEVGLATCFYRSATPRGLWNRLDALSVNAHFLPQAVTAAAFGMRFAMGAAILVRREAFEKSGGFAKLAAHLADDFVLGESVQAAGYRLEYADPVVDSVPDVESASEHIRHQVRWARTIRLCRPGGYLGMIFLHGFSLLSLQMALFGCAPAALALALGILAAKALAEVSLARALTGNGRAHSSLLLLPLSEWLAFGAWLSGYRANRVLWRGELYTVEPEGRLAPLRPTLEVRSPVAAEP